MLLHAFGLNLHGSYPPIGNRIKEKNVFVLSIGVINKIDEESSHPDSIQNECDVSNEGMDYWKP